MVAVEGGKGEELSQLHLSIKTHFNTITTPQGPNPVLFINRRSTKVKGTLGTSFEL